MQGLLAARAGGATLSRALGYLRGLQRRDGSVAYSAVSTQTPVWVTAQALLAFGGRRCRWPTVPRAPAQAPGGPPAGAALGRGRAGRRQAADRPAAQGASHPRRRTTLDERARRPRAA